MNRWRADGVLAWLELYMNMPQYIPECAVNIKSGKVLLGLTESELQLNLNIENSLHLRKLLLALDEFRNDHCTIDTASILGSLDHWWVSERWLRDIGLPQYTCLFRKHLVDGRVLQSLTRKDLEKSFGIDRKLHQKSILRGIELLRMLDFNAQRLDERRQMCQNMDTDLLVWNCSRLAEWIVSIDLKEYADNLRESGVHGSLLVLDSSFTSDELATAIGIPVNKATVRRHLTTEYHSLVTPAKDSLVKDLQCVCIDASDEGTFTFDPSQLRDVNNRSSKRSFNFDPNQTINRRLSKTTISKSRGRQFLKEFSPN